MSHIAAMRKFHEEMLRRATVKRRLAQAAHRIAATSEPIITRAPMQPFVLDSDPPAPPGPTDPSKAH